MTDPYFYFDPDYEWESHLNGVCESDCKFCNDPYPEIDENLTEEL